MNYFFYASGRRDHLLTVLEISHRHATQAQLQILQNQLNPHMLFDTSPNLRVLFATDPKRPTLMLDSLIDYPLLDVSRLHAHLFKAM